jgi:hypothetical protein
MDLYHYSLPVCLYGVDNFTFSLPSVFLTWFTELNSPQRLKSASRYATQGTAFHVTPEQFVVKAFV